MKEVIIAILRGLLDIFDPPPVIPPPPPLDPEFPSPTDFVPRSSITQKEGIVHIDLSKLNVELAFSPEVWMPEIPDTGSMDPTFDANHNNILIKGVTSADHQKLIDALKIGDVAVYSMDGFYSVIHRIHSIGQDEVGRFFEFKGDNTVSNPLPDDVMVRDSNLQWVSVGTIY